MADTITIAGIQFPVATDSVWKLLNPVLKEGEQVFVKDTDASTDYKIKIGDGKTKYADLKFAVDLVEARQLQTQTATKATLATTEANRSKNEADRAKSIADSVGYYTKGESDLKYSPSDLATAEGEILDLYTAEGTMGLEILGKTIVTPADATQPISPDNVAVIESVGESGGIVLQRGGKNLINFQNSYSEVANGVTFTFDQNTQKATLNGTVSGITNLKAFAVGRAYSIYASPGQKITYTIKMVSGSMQGSLLFYSDMIDACTNAYATAFGVGTVTTGAATRTTQYKGLKKIKNTNTVICLEKTSNGTVFNNATFEMQVSYDDSDGIEKSISLPVSITLKDTAGNALEPLRSLPDGTADRLVRIDGVWNLKSHARKVIFKGAESEGWAVDGILQDTIRFKTINYGSPVEKLPSLTSKVHFMSDSFKGLVYNSLVDAESVMVGNSLYINIVIKKSRLSTPDIAGLKTWLANNPTTVIYKLASPTYTPLHPDTQTLLNTLQKAYAGTTVLYGTDLVAPTLKATYARPILEVIDRQIERKKLSNAIIRKAEGDILNMPTAESNMDLEILGNTVVTTRVLTFTTNSITTNGADFKFVIGDVITVAGCTTVANNKTATVVTVSADKKMLAFAPSTFTASVESEASLSTAINTDLPISPDNVAVIESVGELGSVNVVKSSSVNILYRGISNNNVNLASAVANSDGSFTLTATAVGDKRAYFMAGKSTLKPNTIYTLIGEVLDYNNCGVINFHSPSANSPFTTTDYQNTSKIGKSKFKMLTKSVIPVDAWCSFVGIGYVQTTGSCRVRAMLIEGDADIATPYQEGAVMPVSIPLKDTTGNLLEPLRSLPDGTADRLVDIEGVWNVERNVAKSIDVAKCAPVLYLSDATVTKVRILGSMRLFGTTPLSNTIPSVKSHDTKTLGMVPFGGDSSYVVIVMPNNLANITALDTNTDKIAKIVTYLTSIGTEIIYAISPTYTPLHPDTQTLLNNLQKSYAGTTVLYGTDPVAPSFKATYTADINQVIAELQNAIIALGGTNV